MDWKQVASVAVAMVTGFAVMCGIVWVGSPDSRVVNVPREVVEVETPSRAGTDETVAVDVGDIATSPPSAVPETERPTLPASEPVLLERPMAPHESQALYTRAVERFDAGDFESASSLLDRVLTDRRAVAVLTRALPQPSEAQPEGFAASVRAFALAARAAADVERAERLALSDRYAEAHVAVASAAAGFQTLEALDPPDHARPAEEALDTQRERFRRVAWFVGVAFEIHRHMNHDRHDDAWRVYNRAKLARDINAHLTREQHEKLVELGRRVLEAMGRQNVRET